MKKIILFIGLIIVLTVPYISCNDQKSMQEYIREEEQAIKRFIQKQGLTVKETWPDFEDFENDEKLYYKTSGSTYVYMHVIDKGDTTRKVIPWSDAVQVRFDTLLYIKSYIAGDTAAAFPFEKFPPYYGRSPLEFSYGNSASYNQDGSGLPCVGWAIPLNPEFKGALGVGARVNLIIPSISGNAADNNAFCPVFYKNLQYTAFF